jgi:hypothetical protein
MADITATVVVGTTGSNYRSWTLVAADSGTNVVIAHGMGVAPDFIQVTPQYALNATTNPMWAVTAVDSTNITIQKSTGAGTGGTTAGTSVVAKVVAFRPHSILQ